MALPVSVEFFGGPWHGTRRDLPGHPVPHPPGQQLLLPPPLQPVLWVMVEPGGQQQTLQVHYHRTRARSVDGQWQWLYVYCGPDLDAFAYPVPDDVSALCEP